MRTLAAILLGFAALASVASASADEVVQSAGGIPYVSGGVGTESLEQLNSMAGDFNLKLVFALHSGDFLSAVEIKISDAKGKAVVLEATSEGPLFLARLPAGNYQVAATRAGKTLIRRIVVGATRLKTVDFHWAAE